MSKFRKSMLVIFIIGVTFMIGIGKTMALTHLYTNYFGIEMTREEYLNLTNLGFTEDEIYYMNEKTFLENKDLVGSVLTAAKHYYKTVYPAYGMNYSVELTEDEYYSELEDESNIKGNVVTEYKTMISSITALTNKYRYKVTLDWTKTPSVKSHDIIGIGFNGNIHMESSPSFYYTYTGSGGTGTYNTFYSKKTTSTGGTTVFKLPSDMSSLTATMYFNVVKDANAGTITSLTMCGDYSHAIQTVTGSQAGDHTVNIYGNYLNSSIYNKYDNIPCANSYMNVSW